MKMELLLNMKELLNRYPLLILIVSAAGIGILQLLKEGLNTSEPSWVLVVAVLVLHVLKLLLIAFAIVILIVITRNYKENKANPK